MTFETAYELSKKGNLDKYLIIGYNYNMAYEYLKGIGIKENIRKGKHYLNELAKVLKKYNEDILTIDDPDNIIVEYFEKD